MTIHLPITASTEEMIAAMRAANEDRYKVPEVPLKPGSDEGVVEYVMVSGLIVSELKQENAMLRAENMQLRHRLGDCMDKTRP